MKWFVGSLICFLTAALLSRHWSSEAASGLPIAQKVASAAPVSAYQCPPSHPIKGNFTPYSGERCIYHLPGGRFYDKTKPEKCYATPDAKAAGCRASKL